MKASQIILKEFEAQSKHYENVINIFDVIDDEINELFKSFGILTQAYKDALYMEEQLRGSEEDRQVHLYDIMNDFMVRNNLSGSEALEPVDEHMKQFQSMSLAELEGLASKVEHPTQKGKS